MTPVNCPIGLGLILFAPLAPGRFMETAVYYTSNSSNSSGALGCLFFIGCVVFVAVVAGLTAYAARRRSEKVGAAATAFGYSFRRLPTEADQALITGSTLATAGRNRVVSDIIEVVRTEELQMTLFDYSYTIGSGKSRREIYQTITRMQSPLIQLPSFILFQETILSKLGKLFGGTDINFPDAPAFSSKYVLRGADETAIRALFSPTVMQFLEQQEHLTIEVAGDLMFTYRAYHRPKPEQLESFIAEGKQILALFFEAQQGAP